MHTFRLSRIRRESQKRSACAYFETCPAEALSSQKGVAGHSVGLPRLQKLANGFRPENTNHVREKTTGFETLFRVKAQQGRNTQCKNTNDAVYLFFFYIFFTKYIYIYTYIYIYICTLYIYIYIHMKIYLLDIFFCYISHRNIFCLKCIYLYRLLHRYTIAFFLYIFHIGHNY